MTSRLHQQQTYLHQNEKPEMGKKRSSFCGQSSEPFFSTTRAYSCASSQKTLTSQTTRSLLDDREKNPVTFHPSMSRSSHRPYNHLKNQPSKQATEKQDTSTSPSNTTPSDLKKLQTCGVNNVCVSYQHESCSLMPSTLTGVNITLACIKKATEAILSMMNQCTDDSSFSDRRRRQQFICTRHLEDVSLSSNSVCPATRRKISSFMALPKPPENDTKRYMDSLQKSSDRIVSNSHLSSSRHYRINYLPSDLTLLKKVFHSTYYQEFGFYPRKPLQLPETTLWQYIWHVYDNKTLKIRWKRLRDKLYKNQPDSRQMFFHPELVNSSALTWRHAWKSHIELTFFSIENVPYISQVVIETESFRIDLPFNVQFLRIPILADWENQVITVWFNSAYPAPYERCYSKFLYTGNLPSPNDIDEEYLENIESLTLNDSTFYKKYRDAEQEALLLHRQEHHMMTSDKKYHPRNRDWPCYFKLVIPVNSVCKKSASAYSETSSSGVEIEDQVIVAPQGVLYENYDGVVPHEYIFNQLQELSYSRPLDPILKFHAKAYIQGYHQLVYCGNDTLPPHVLSESNPLSPEYFDGSKFLYRVPEKAIPGLSLRGIYVANVKDFIDCQVAIAVNRRNQHLLRIVESNVGPEQEPITRLYKGLYNIYQEIHIKILKVDTRQKKWNFRDYELDKSDSIFDPKDPFFLILPFAYDDDFYQPLHDYILQHKRNLQFAAVEHLESEQAYLHQEISIPSLPNLILPNSELPCGIVNNPESILRLTQHAQAIKKNIVRSYLLQFSDKKIMELVNTEYKIEDFVEDLNPPLLCLDKTLSPEPVTFIWDEDLTNVRLAPVKEPLPDHLTPIWTKQSSENSLSHCIIETYKPLTPRA